MTNKAEKAVCECVIESLTSKGHCRECSAAFNGHRAAVFTHTQAHKQTNSYSNSRQYRIEDPVVHRMCMEAHKKYDQQYLHLKE